MATMFFAGIPLEGSGIRPLEADLYNADGQNTDHENLSATGNLNVGNVIRYDEHAVHHLTGGILDEPVTGTSLTPSTREAFPTFAQNGSQREVPSGDSSNSTLYQTTALSNPAFQNTNSSPVTSPNNVNNATPGQNANTVSSGPNTNSTRTSAVRMRAIPMGTATRIIPIIRARKIRPILTIQKIITRKITRRIITIR